MDRPGHIEDHNNSRSSFCCPCRFRLWPYTQLPLSPRELPIYIFLSIRACVCVLCTSIGYDYRVEDVLNMSALVKTISQQRRSPFKSVQRLSFLFSFVFHHLHTGKFVYLLFDMLGRYRQQTNARSIYMHLFDH